MNAIAARKLLRETFPKSKPELNHIYRLESGTCQGERCVWHKKIIDWNDRLRNCGNNVRVGILDAGIDRKHPSLRGQKLKTASFVRKGRSRPPKDHGTAIASLLVGRLDSLTPGLVPGARMYAADVFHMDKTGQSAANTLDLLKGLNWLKRNNVKLVNMSLSGPANDILADAIEKLTEQGIIFIAAAGNGGPDAEPSYPAAYPNVIAVTAVDEQLQAYRRANQGNYIDIAGPGVGLWAASPGKKADYRSGTSYATPIVTAVLAIMYDDARPKISVQDLIEELPIMDLGSKGRDPIYGRGLIMAPKSCGAKKAHKRLTRVKISLPRRARR